MPSSGLMCWEYVAVYGCVRALTAAVVAVTVAVRDTSGTFRRRGGESNQGSTLFSVARVAVIVSAWPS